MSCLCGHGESCNICNPDPRIEELQKTLREIKAAADKAMTEAHPMVGARALMTFRWIGKLASRALGETDD